MKRALTVLLVVLLSISSVFAGGTEETAASSDAQKVYKIGVATIYEGEAWEIQKKYYQEEVAPALNMEFMFSEKLADSNGLMDFMDQAYAAGCVAIINTVTSGDAVRQGSRKAEELGMYFVTQNSAIVEDVATVEHNLGHCGASATGMTEVYKEAMNELLSDGKEHSIFIFSGAAVGGAIGQGAASHYYTVEGILTAMQEKYGLTYTKTIDELINNQNPGEVETGNPNVRIYIYPGVNINSAIAACQTQFQNGPYDIFCAVFSYSAFTNAISDVEKTTGKDIKILATANIEKQTETGFSTTDSFGSTVLNAACINPITVANSINCVLLYNALTGHADAMKDNGHTVLFKVKSWFCKDAEMYEKINQLDKSHDTYVISGEELKQLCVEFNPSVTYRDLEAKLLEVADVEKVIAEKLN